MLCNTAATCDSQVLAEPLHNVRNQGKLSGIKSFASLVCFVPERVEWGRGRGNSLVSGSLQNTLGQFWLSPILRGKIVSFRFAFKK